MNNIFDTTSEVAMQCLITINCLNKKSLSLDRLWLINFLSLYAKDFKFSEINLYGDSIYSSVQLTVRHEKVKRAILLLVSKHLIKLDERKIGKISITQKGQDLVEKLNSDFASSYKVVTNSIYNTLKNMSDLELLAFTYEHILNKE